MSATKEMIGLKFNRLLVVDEAGRSKNRKKMWRCVCDCGNETTVRGDHLRRGCIRSCGCEKTNAYGVSALDSKSPLVSTFMNMIYRCEDPKHKAYYRYGKRGISVCKEWHDFRVFEKWAIAHGWHRGLELDRIDNNGNYTPTNCRIATRAENMRNTSVCVRTLYKGKELCLAEIADLSGVKYATVYARYQYGWRGESLGLPVQKRTPKHF